MTSEIKGFGFTDALNVLRTEENWVIEKFLPKGFTFIAGLPKAGNSPHGGKSVLTDLIAISIITGRPFLGNAVKQQGKVLMVNLDEPQYAQGELLQRLMGNKKQEGILLSNAYTMSFPKDFPALENDIQVIKPSVVILDPLFRFMSGGDVKESRDVNPILTGLKELQRKYDLTIIVVHHCTKKPNRDKESSSTWLNGTIELDSFWDACIGVEWDRKISRMHLRCFYKKHETQEVFYVAKKDEQGNIHDLIPTEETKVETSAERIIKALQSGHKTVPELATILCASQSSVKRILTKLKDSEVKEHGKQGNAPLWGLVNT